MDVKASLARQTRPPIKGRVGLEFSTCYQTGGPKVGKPAPPLLALYLTFLIFFFIFKIKNN